MTESEIQRAVFQNIRERGMPGVVAWAVPNTPQARRVPGFRRGASDVHAIHVGKFYVMELKKDGGRASEEQLKFNSEVNAAGGYAVVAEGLDQALACLEAWGLIRRAA